jgi:hypothetical protein
MKMYKQYQSKRTIYFVIDNLLASTPNPTYNEPLMMFNSPISSNNKLKLTNIKSSGLGGAARNGGITQSSTILYDTLTIDFPIDFIQTSNPKFVSVKNAKYYDYLNSEAPPQISVCSDIIQSEKYSDSFLCFCNEAQRYKSLQIYDTRANFYLWLKNEKGEIIDLDPVKGRIFVELLLEF